MLEELVKRLFERFFRSAHFTATVLSVDKGAGVCTVQEEGGPEREGVRLVAVTGGYASRFLVFPKVGSEVTVAVRYNQKTELYVSQCSEVEEITAQVGQFNWSLNKDGITGEGTGGKYELDSSGFKFNDGTLGGLVNINVLLLKLNQLEVKMAAHQHLVGVVPTLPDPATNAPLPITLLQELEDIKVKH